MIKVDDLIAWAMQSAIGRSISYPNGWIDATALKKLAEQVEQSEPLPCKPTVDAVQVVRCKDCQWFDANSDYYDGYCDKNGLAVDDDFYCADGERKDGERRSDGEQ